MDTFCSFMYLMPEVFHVVSRRVCDHVSVVRVQPRVGHGQSVVPLVSSHVSSRIHLWPVRVRGRRGQARQRLRGRRGHTGPARPAPASKVSTGCAADSVHDGRALVRTVRVLLHVLGQVGLLGVALAAILANVSLQVFRLLKKIGS